MIGITARQCSSWVLLSLLAINLALMAGCAGKTASTRYLASNASSACYAKALPTAGEGGLGDHLEHGAQKIHG